jgi:hypothetical protein
MPPFKNSDPTILTATEVYEGTRLFIVEVIFAHSACYKSADASTVPTTFRDHPCVRGSTPQHHPENEEEKISFVNLRSQEPLHHHHI